MPHPLMALASTPLTVNQLLADFPCEELTKPNPDSRAWFLSGYFLKWAPAEAYPTTLARDVAICRTPPHLAIIPILHKITTADGTLLIYPKIEGVALSTPERRQRFFALPVPEKLRALQTIFAALSAVVAQGWVMHDFYEGNVIYNFDTRTSYLFDFEFFMPGDSYILQADRAYGSARLMAPEEFSRGAVIDQASNVYTLGRYAICALSLDHGERWADGFQGSPDLAEVLRKATQPDRAERYQTVQAFLEAFTLLTSTT